MPCNASTVAAGSRQPRGIWRNLPWMGSFHARTDRRPQIREFSATTGVDGRVTGSNRAEKG